ncbi:MAG: hypothetical protein ACYCR3_09565 [Acidithiobacillus sp.]
MFHLDNPLSAPTLRLTPFQRGDNYPDTGGRRRSEIYQFFPMLSVKSEPDQDKIKIDIRNDSPTNTSSELDVQFVLRIHSESTFGLDKEGSFKLAPLGPNSQRDDYPIEINNYVKKGLAFLRDSDPGQSHFVLRIVVKYSSAHPDAELLAKSDTAYYKYIDGELRLERRGD